MTDSQPVVFVVDDDPGVCKALGRLVRAAGFEVLTFSSPEAFLEEHDPTAPGCLVLDVALPGLNGLELQDNLARAGCPRSIIFITGKGDIPTSVRAMKAGAVDFLTKPVDDEQLLAAIRAGLARENKWRREQAEVASIQARLATLTEREHEVLEHIISGEINKQIAGQLGTVEKTIKVHRGRVMMKMGAHSLAELVRLAARAGVAPVHT